MGLLFPLLHYFTTSDFGPGTFIPCYGEKNDDIVTLWEAPVGENNTSDILVEEFADRIAVKAEAAGFIPGNRPYKKAGGAGLVPKSTKDCVKCGLCAGSCPVQAIDPASITADTPKCIACMRCVKQCPHQARKVNSAMVSIAAVAIKKACSVRKENELFL